jgi:hypothetical protein
MYRGSIALPGPADGGYELIGRPGGPVLSRTTRLVASST